MKEVTIAFVVLQLAYSVVKAQVSISTYPVPLHVTVGTSFTLSCNYNHHSFVSWQHPSLGVVSQTTGHVTLHVLDDAAVATLIVSDASPNRDEGRYTCTARSNTGVMVTQSVQAELYHAVRITTPSNQVFMALQGDVATVSLPCAAVNHSQIAWRRAGVSTELRNTSDGHLVVLPDRLVINNVRFSDNGTYECTASNRVGHESILSHLNVHVSAGVTASPVSSMVAEGSPAEFVFTVTGNPLPNVEWYKDTIGDDFRITPSPSHLESVLTDSITSVYRLRFSSVRSQDTGTYICQVHNQFGVPVSAQITLQLSDALGPPQQVRATLLRQTSINVTWSRPDGADMVDSYTVVWQSRNESPKSYVIGGDVLFYVINEGLTRLTQYTVYVYASNSRGKGSDSQRVNITTDAIAPAAPLEVNVMDIGPTSVRLEWRFGDNGGAPIIGIHVTFVTLGSDMEFVDIEISPGQTSALIPDLKDSHQYVLSLQAKNRIGLSPSLDSAVFRTAPPGRPGSPSHVTGTWLSGDQTALVCWEPSEVGQPFLSYTIEVLELKSNVTKIWKLSVDVVKDNLPNCTAGYSVTGLIIGVCYRFKVVVSNSQGTGFPSAYSEDFCVPSVDSQGMQSGSGQPLLTKYIVAIAVSLPVVVLVGAGLIIMWCICVRVRHNRSTAKLPTGPLPPDRRSSERSNQMLIDPSFHHQISIGSYTSSGSGNSVSGGEETPNTAATMLSENPFTFDNVVNSRNQLSSTFTQQDYPQSSSASRPQRSGSATLPAMNGSALPPIPEHTTTPSHTLPFHATPPQYPYPNEHPPSYPSYFPTPPSSMGPGLQENFEEEVEMTDNPLNIEFEKKMLAGGNPSRPNYSHEIDLPEDEPPPYVPPYRGDDMESEMSIPIGESCSQPPRSPQLSYQQRNNSRNRTNHDRSALGLNRDHNVMTPASFNISCSENEEEESEFFDNEAYQKVQESQFIGGGGFGSQNNVLGSSRCSPVVTMEGGYGSQQRMIEDSEGESSKPRFKIGRSARRGEVFEKVELRH